jgi:hypothetical protein
MSCKTCVKINPIPECLETGEELILTGISVVDNSVVDHIILKDEATGRTIYVTFEIAGSTEIKIDLTGFLPLMNHPYEIRLLGASMESLPFTLTNTDNTTVEGCCIEFNVMPKLVWAGGDLSLSTTTCEV